MTLEIDSLKNTSPTVTIAGSISIDGMNLFSMTSRQFGAFSSERSFFDPSLTIVTVHSATVEYLKLILNSGDLPIVVGSAWGRLRIYM